MQKMEEWLANPSLMSADADAEYSAVIEIDLADVNEPIVCCPNDPDDARLLSQVAGAKVDEIFIGSCMTNIGHFAQRVSCWIRRALWMHVLDLPADAHGCSYADGRGLLQHLWTGGRAHGNAGCSLCMGNQARVLAGATVMSTSTRNFPNRLGMAADVYLASAELSAVGGVLGRLPTQMNIWSTPSSSTRCPARSIAI